MKRHDRHSLTDEDLLSRKDWRSFTDRQLKRAVTLARWKARAAFRRRREEVQNGADWSLMEEKPHLVMYLSYCACQYEDQDMSEWDGCQYIDSINDPRIYEFCTVYDSYQRRFLGLPSLRNNRGLLIDLLKRRGADLVVSEKSLRLNQAEFERWPEPHQRLHQQMLDAMAKGHLQLLHEYLLYRMLLTHSTGKWLDKTK